MPAPSEASNAIVGEGPPFDEVEFLEGIEQLEELNDVEPGAGRHWRDPGTVSAEPTAVFAADDAEAQEKAAADMSAWSTAVAKASEIWPEDKPKFLLLAKQICIQLMAP